jgi:hypothetical protein
MNIVVRVKTRADRGAALVFGQIGHTQAFGRLGELRPGMAGRRLMNVE